MSGNAIQLDDSLLIGKGLHRYCYHHPLAADLCIKVALDNSRRSIREINRELRFYRFLNKRKGSEKLAVILPGYHGAIDTSLGTGHLFDLVRDADGQVSRPLSHYLPNSAAQTDYGEHIRTSYQAFCQDALQGDLVTMALKPYNMLFQILDNDEYRLVLIDSLGTANLIPLAYFSRTLARSKMQRHLTRFEQSLVERFDFDIVAGR